ncbi:alanine racemase C-terminal domain-containing protein [Rhodopseudomonas sp. NSM]|uniref:alanine racemase C-terminal domain-containing protein n=1 Tax=Rhodopseudomonas sp. NSM TaxID=3457630 RepID=UPI00403564BB
MSVEMRQGHRHAGATLTVDLAAIRWNYRCLDSLTIALGDLPDGSLARGAEIKLIGPHQSVDELASASGTIGYEILTGLGDRYRRIYRDVADRPQGGEFLKEMVP